MQINRVFIFLLVAGPLLFGLPACQPGEATAEAEILWDDWGVPHIYAQNNDDLFYSFGWAQMHNHGNLILRLYARSSGRAAELFGESQIQNDQLIHGLGFPEVAADWLNQYSEDFRGHLQAFTSGLNDYAADHPEAIDSTLRPMLPLDEKQVVMHGLFVIYTRFVAGSQLSSGVRWAQRGSNTYAIGPSRSANGNTMLVQNPHLPWNGEFTWIEAHLNTPELNLYGATLVGLPVLGIAFNENLGWSHTNNTIDPADLYLLELQDDGYLYDGEVRAFEQRTDTIQVKTEDGLSARPITSLRSVHGPVIGRRGEQAVALRLPPMDRPHQVQQWWEMGKASNFEEFEAAIQKLQIPFFNIMYADREDNIFYMFNGHVPRRPENGWGFWSGLIPGDTSRYLWEDILTYEELPKVKNPASGFLQNANDPPWTSTFPRVLSPEDFPAYLAPVEMGFRPQRAVRMAAEDTSITYAELIDYKLSTRMELADRLLDDLLIAAEAYGSDLGRQAATVLEAWDRQADADSRGAALFVLWEQKWNSWNPGNYEEQWSLAKARQTPDGLADPESAVRALEAAAEELQSNFGALDVPYGELLRLQRGAYDLPGNGANGSTGIFRVTWGSQGDDGKYYASGGDSWVGLIEFADSVRAKVLLSYGNASNPQSPHYGDQLELYSQKSLRDARFYREDVEPHVEWSVRLVSGEMIADQ